MLIIDELSYLTFNRYQSELLFKVIADRAERKSVIVSTNLKFAEWTTMFENTTMVTALIDRLTFRSHVLNMNSDNPYRAEQIFFWSYGLLEVNDYFEIVLNWGDEISYPMD